jgi:hypothetical protein
MTSFKPFKEMDVKKRNLSVHPFPPIDTVFYAWELKRPLIPEMHERVSQMEKKWILNLLKRFEKRPEV